MAANLENHNSYDSQLSRLECDAVLSTVRRTIQNVTATVIQGSNHNHVEQRRLVSCLNNINRIRHSLDLGSYEEVETALQNLIDHVTPAPGTGVHQTQGTRHDQQGPSREPATARATERAVFSADRIRPQIGSKGGRPKLDVTKQQLKFLTQEGYTCKQMAVHLSCSTSYIYKKLASFNIQLRKKYSPITEEELDQHVSNLHKDFPNSGQQMMTAYLKVDGIVVQRSRVRAALHRVDPPSVAKRWSKVVKRRAYKVPNPNSLWHMDGHMKLIRWKLVTHGCIDGYSRCIVYLHCGRDNSTLSVLKLFAQATVEYGLPSRTRSDHGGENYFVALFMELVQGKNRGSHITGESKHNQRIERLWRDVFLHVISYFYDLFYHLEDEDLLNVDDPLDVEALHRVYLPEINRRLHFFHKAWNRHTVRTEEYRTPRQMWVSGMLDKSTSHTAVDHVFSTERDVASDLQQALNHYGLAANALGEMDELADAPMGQRVLPPAVNITNDRIYELVVESFTVTSDIKERFKLLREWLHEEVDQGAS